MTERSVHSLCRSIVVPLLEAGLGIEHVADHLGHKNIQNTQIYAQITPSLRQEVFVQLARHPKIVRLPADVGPRVVQLPFPAPLLAEGLATPSVLDVFDNGQFMLIFFFVYCLSTTERKEVTRS